VGASRGVVSMGHPCGYVIAGIVGRTAGNRIATACPDQVSSGKLLIMPYVTGDTMQLPIVGKS